MLKKLSVEVNIIILIKINLYMDKIFYIYNICGNNIKILQIKNKKKFKCFNILFFINIKFIK